MSENLLKKEYLVAGDYLNAMKKDKKFTGNLHTCILFTGRKVERYSDISDDEIMEAVDSAF